jgi:hypothetical protein
MKEVTGILIASDAGISIRSFGDISDAIGACIGADGLILTESDLAPEFFNLRSGLAGELFQKFTNYKVRVAIVLPDPEAYGERFSELAYEHRSHSRIRFVGSAGEAKAWLDA